jgi:MFS family permease
LFKSTPSPRWRGSICWARLPPDKRGGYLSIWESAKAAGVLLVAAATGYVLSDVGPAFPDNYAVLFLLSGVMMMVSAVALIAIYETPPAKGETTSVHIPWREFPTHLGRIWRSDERLRNMTISRVLYSLGLMSNSFYVLYATKEMGLDTQTVGLFISATTIGSLLGTLFLGRLADRFGSARAIQVGIGFALAAPLLALGFTFMRDSLPPWIAYAYAGIYLCIGIIENLMILGYMNYALDLAPSGQRTIYMGTTNAIGSIGVLGPMIGGWLLGATSYATLYIAAAACGLGALMLALRLPDIRGTLHTKEEEPPDSAMPAGGSTQTANPHPD